MTGPGFWHQMNNKKKRNKKGKRITAPGFCGGELSQSQRQLGEPRVDMSQSHVRKRGMGREREEGETRCISQEAQRE